MCREVESISREWERKVCQGEKWRHAAGQCGYAGLRDTTWKCLPFLLPSIQCRVALCNRAWVQNIPLPPGLRKWHRTIKLQNRKLSIRFLHWLSLHRSPLRFYSQVLSCTSFHTRLEFDAGFLKDGCEHCHTGAGQENLAASLGFTWPSLLVMALKLRFLVCNMKMLQMCCKDALRTREEVLPFFFLKSATPAQVALKATCIIYSQSKGGHESQLGVLLLCCVPSQSLSSLTCTAGRVNKQMSLLHMLRKAS